MKIKMLIGLTTAFVTKLSFATPTIYPKDLTFLSQIQNTTTSNLVADNSDQKVFWVMPPNTASSKVGSLHSITANVGYCQEMANLQSYSRSMSLKMKELQEKELDSQQEVEALSLKVSRARQAYSDFVIQKDLTDISNLDERISIVSAEINTLNDRLNECQEHCDEIIDQLKELRDEKIKLAESRLVLIKNRVGLVRDMERKRQSVLAYEKDLAELDERWAKLKDKLQELRSRFNQMYATFGSLEGARASIAFESQWDKNVEELQRINPGHDFKRIDTQNAVVLTNIVHSGDFPTTGAVLSYDIAGASSNGKITFPSYPQSLSGNLRLSLIGTCPVLHPEMFNINLPNGTDQMKYGMTISYEYPSSFEVDVIAKYNMYKMYQKIASSTRRGGFFSSSKRTSLEEKTFFRDEFKVTWEEQDAGNSLSEEKKADIEKEIRDDIFGRLAALGLPSVSNPGALIAPDANPSGAAVLASSLSKNDACKANKYCIAAAIGLSTLDAIFGSASTNSSYTNIQDVEMTESWSRKKVVYKPWISSYR